MIRKKGFTLVEIMIVVAIIALLAAIAIPNLLRARHNANETAAISSCRTISTSLESYRSSQTPVSYPANLPALACASPPYIDSVLALGSKQGYEFNFTAGGSRTVGSNTIYEQYTLVATPAVSGTTGTRSFYVDETGVIRVSTLANTPASNTSPPLE